MTKIHFADEEMYSPLSRSTLIVGSRFAHYGFVFASFVMIARQLGPFDFGLFAAGQGLANLIAPFIELGGYSLVTRDLANGRTVHAALSPAVSTIIMLSPASLLIGCAIAAAIMPAYAVVAVCLLFLCETCFARLLDLIYASNFSRGRIGANAMIDILGGIARVLMAGLLLLSSGGLISWAGIYAGGSFILLATCWTLFAREARPSWLAPSILAERIRRGFNFALITGARSGHAEFDRVLLAGIGGPEMAGVYSAAGRMVLVLTVPFHLLQMAIYPRFFRTGGDYAEGRRLALRQATAAAPAALVLAIGLWIGSDSLPLLLGPGYDGLPLLVKTLAPIIVLSAIYEPFGSALNGSSCEGLRRQFQIMALGANIFANLLLIPSFGFFGSAIAAVLSHSLLLVLFVYVAGRYRGQLLR